MPINYRNYPENWHSEIRPRILRRAGGDPVTPKIGARCETCGVRNYSVYHKPNRLVLKTFDSYTKARLFAKHYPSSDALKTVVLTIAHLDHDVSNNDESNLKALCQACHTRYDARHKQQSRKRGK